MSPEEPIIESILHAYAGPIGTDFNKYRNHVYRVFNHCTLLDPGPENRQLYAIAAAFHDIGIWTDHTIDYLAPSIEQAVRYLKNGGGHSMQAQISAMIEWHHKLSTYRGPFRETTEVFRKADWADVSLGLLTFGMDRRRLRQMRKTWPNAGFHFFLVRKILPNFLRHPFNPLPMFKR